MSITSSAARVVFRYSFYKKNISTLATLLVFLAVIYEFPASVVYGVLSSFGLVELNNFASNRLLFAAIVIFVSVLNLFLNPGEIFKKREFRIYFLLFCYMIIVVWLNREEYAFLTLDDVRSISAVEYWIPKFFKYILFFFIGLQLVNFAPYKPLLILSLVVSGAVVLWFVDYELLGLNRREFVAGANAGIYQFLGDAFAITALLCFALCKRSFSRFIIFIFAAVVIFFIGSRTSFVVFAFTVLCFYVLMFKLKWLPVYICLCAAIAAYASTLDFNELAETNRRMVGVFLDYDDDNSVQGRRLLTERGWEDIRENPIFGRFGGQRDSGEMFVKYEWNSYMHNIVSYWRQFGILLFSAICYLYYRFGWLVASKISQKNTTDFRIYFLVGVFIVVESVFSRSYAFTVTHILFGLVVSLNLPHTRGKKWNSLSLDKSVPGETLGTARTRKRKRKKKHFSF